MPFPFNTPLFDSRWNKERLYILQFSRPGHFSDTENEHIYSWALMIGPKKERPWSRGKMCFADESTSHVGGTRYRYYERDSTVGWQTLLRTRVVVGKVRNKFRLMDAIRRTTINDYQHDYNSLRWVRDAMGDIEADGKSLAVANYNLDNIVDRIALYQREKAEWELAHPNVVVDPNIVPTFSMLHASETTP